MTATIEIERDAVVRQPGVCRNQRMHRFRECSTRYRYSMADIKVREMKSYVSVDRAP